MEREVRSANDWLGRWFINWMDGSEWFQSLPQWGQVTIASVPFVIMCGVIAFFWIKDKQRTRASSKAGEAHSTIRIE